jgi:hypothetical protein
MDRARCARCGDVIGVYEPLRVITADGRRVRGSPLTLSSELGLPGSSAFHEQCYREIEDAPTGRAGGE